MNALDLTHALADLARVDATIALPIAVLVAAIALKRRRRPITRDRVMEVALPALLLIMVGCRYAILAVVTAVLPTAVLGPSADPTLAGVLVGFYIVAAVVGFASWNGSVGRKAFAAGVFVAVTLVEAGYNLLVLDATAVPRIDTALSIAVATLTAILAAFHWTRRTATPNPLGGKGPPFDY